MKKFNGKLTIEGKYKLRKAFEEKLNVHLITENDCIFVVDYLKDQYSFKVKEEYKRSIKREEEENEDSEERKEFVDKYPISIRTLKNILINENELKFDINTINDLARGLGYRSYEDFLNNYLSNSELKDLIHPDDFMNEDIKKGDVFFVGTASVYVKLECMEDYFKFRILRGYNITRKTGIFHATDFKLSDGKLKLVDKDDFYKSHEFVFDEDYFYKEDSE